MMKSKPQAGTTTDCDNEINNSSINTEESNTMVSDEEKKDSGCWEKIRHGNEQSAEKPKQETKIVDGNWAVASASYRMNDIAYIFPITPSSAMGEIVDAWASTEDKNGEKKVLNLWNQELKVCEMQSEGGAAGALHGALVSGSLATTYTASQGLLLFIPNLYKIAGELLPTVIHVAARALAGQALSIYGDHSDVMLVRSTGLTMVSSFTVQEAHDMAIVTQIATLKSRVPFLHFMDGFRTSHEINKIELASDDVLRELMPWDKVEEHRQRALSPLHPSQLGTAQSPDVFMQMAESSNTHYHSVNLIFEQALVDFSRMTGRQYRPFEYHYFGSSDPQIAIVTMGSSVEVFKETLKHIESEQVCVIGVRLFRPWNPSVFCDSLPKSVKRIATLDRTKESGAQGEPLYMDVCASLMSCKRKHMFVAGGRYGLASKDFSPRMAMSVINNLLRNDMVNLLQTDYRGTISKTALGYPCEKWDAPLIKVVWGKDYPKEFPNAGLDDNYCRNPGDDRGAYCFVAGGQGYGYCDVPVCGSVTESPTSTSIPTSSTVPTGSPSSSILPSSSSSPTRVCPVADREVCGCDVVRQSDYRGTISATNDGFDCIRWDSELAKELNYRIDFVRDFPGAGLEDNYCRNPGNLDSGPFCMTPFPTIEGAYIRSCDVPKCEPCACSPLCGRSNDAACACPSVFQADECCEKDDADCKCPYLKEACSKSLEVEGESKEFCEDASVACCGGNTEGDNICKCAMHEQICMDFPSQSTCDYAAEVCCETDQCYCDFYTYSTTFSVTQSDDKAGKCSEAQDRQFVSVTAEKLILREIYHILAGEYWIDSTSWLNDTVPHCDWFGIECDQEGHVIEIILRDNNLEGELQNDYPAILPGLTKFDLAGNKISAKVDTNALLYNRQLVHLDLSRNSFSGHIDMTFPPSTSYVNISHNNLTSAGFKRFNPAYERLRVIDLSNNRIDQDASTFFFDIPRNLEKLVLSNNILKGALPNPFPLPNMGIFKIDNNAISGALPDFPAPRLKMLDVSNQKKGEYDGGLSGPIPTTLSNLIDLTVLNLAGNKFTQEIPPDLGNLHFLRVLNISSNALDKSIPSELETLKDFLEVLDLSSNRLSGSIPLELAKLQDTLVHFNLRGNSNFLGPAPLDLCFLPGFDLLNNASFCPPERNALREIYDSTKGIEWTESKLWLHPVISHCDWYGVTCKENNTNTIKLELRNNGLSGKLGEEIALLTHLEVLDLSDNDIKGSIPTEIRKLSHLKYVRLCYNGFIGNETNFGNLQDLELIQIHGNRLSGTIPRLNLTFSNKSSFVSDCGNPSDFEQPLICDECKMCCNAQGDCYSTELHPIQNSEFKTFLYFSCAFIGMLFAASGVLASAMYARNRFQNRGMPESSIRCPSYKGKDRKYALSTIGNDSVYQFFLRNSWQGWIIVLLTLGAQFWLLFIFVGGAEIDWRNDQSDLVYTWQCRRDEDECVDTNDLDPGGWIAFSILMIAHLLKDIINGTKLIGLSAKQRHSHHKRARFFVGGTLLTTVSLFTLYVSTIYNNAIATNNREIIENSVIILFICDIDEMLYGIFMVINEDWVHTMSIEENNQDADVETSRQDKVDSLEEESQHETNQTLALADRTGAVSSLNDEVQSLKTVVGALQETVRQQHEQLKRLIPTP